jgi:hypothetical protein
MAGRTSVDEQRALITSNSRAVIESCPQELFTAAGDRVVQRLLQHVNAISPADGKRDKQVLLPPFGVEDLDLEADRMVGGGVAAGATCSSHRRAGSRSANWCNAPV